MTTPATPAADSAAIGDLSLGQRLRHRLAFWAHRLRGRDYPMTVRLFGQPVTLIVTAGRELHRAAAVSYEGDFLGRLLAHIQPGDTFFDVGANIGLVSVLVAAQPHGRTATIHAFEPEPRNHAQLERNLAANRLAPRAHAHAVALAREEGTAALFVRGSAGEGRHSLVAKKGATGSIAVPLTTMTAFCARHDTRPDVLKIDVEGAEGDVLAGMAGLLETHHPREIFMEIHNKGGEDRMPDGTLIDDWLATRGYTRVWERARGTGRHRHYR
jgi:FkbM family methyltransferase